MEINDLTKLLKDFKLCPKNETNATTFLEIAGCPHYENVWSNILAFYLNPNEKHGFGDMLLKTFLNLIGEESIKVEKTGVEINREYQTKNKNRIDIVVETNNFVLGIENKVNASLYNDLNDYADAINEFAKGRPTFKIVLSKYKSTCDKGFKNLLYNDLINQLKQTIKFETQNKYHVFLKDFIENIENEINENPMNNNPELVKFFTENHTTIADLLAYSNRMNDYVFKKLQTIHNLLLSEFKTKIYKTSECFSQNGHYLSCLYLKVKDMTFCWQTGVIINSVNFFTSCYPTDNSKEIPALEGKGYPFDPTFSVEEIIGEIEKQIRQIIEEISKT